MNKASVRVILKGLSEAGKADQGTREFAVPVGNGVSVLAALRTIQEQYDRTLAYRNVNCHIGICNACMMRINGRMQRACSVRLLPGEVVTVEVDNRYKLIRELVADFQHKASS